MTVEPGLYFIPYLLDKIRNGEDEYSKRMKKFINWEELERGKYVEKVGGVRIEDVVVVEKEGARVISRRESWE
ncbi:hypothetical protein HDV00_006261 [Rhizophlyctis rosea]|nr:hypothetical protein HDV00_006261 [Rhizophlyctis rosea]